MQQWTEERIREEIVAFAEHGQEVLGKEFYPVLESLKKVPVEISSRMTKCKGSFHFKRTYNKKKELVIKPKVLKFAKHLLDEYYDFDIIETIKHECVHYIICTYFNSDEGHSPKFKKMCRKLGTSDETYFKAEKREDVIAKEEKEKKIACTEKTYKYRVICMECGHIYYRQRLDKKKMMQNYRCGKCKGKLFIVDDKEKKGYILSQYNRVNTLAWKQVEKMLRDLDLDV